MPIDSSIYFQQQGIDPGRIGRGIEDGLRMRDLLEQKAEREKLKAEDKAIQDAYSKNYVVDENGQGSLNQQKFMSDLAGSKAVRAQRMMEFQDKMREQSAADLKTRMERSAREIDLVARAAGGIKDQATYSQAIDWLGKQGVDVSKMPSAYDPGLVQQYHIRALNAKEQLDQRNKEEELNIKRQEAGAKKIEANAKARESGVGGAPGKMTEAQSKALGFGRRAMIADQMVDQLTSDPSANVTSLKTQIKSSLPKWMGGIRNQREQDLATAKLGFVASVLRKESGAAVTPQEFETYDRMYFPQPGDSKETLANKSILRKNFVDTEKMTAGRAWRDPLPLKGPQQKQTPDRLDSLSDADLDRLYRQAGGT
jgi:hypothetical protein